MKKSKFLIIFITILIVAIVTGTIAIVVRKKQLAETNNTEIEQNNETEEFVQIFEDGTKINVSEKLLEPKQVEGLTIDNISLTSKDFQTQLVAKVTNATEKSTELMLVKITLYDKNGKQIDSLDGIISPLTPGETTVLNVNSSLDYANAYNFDITKTN